MIPARDDINDIFKELDIGSPAMEQTDQFARALALIIDIYSFDCGAHGKIFTLY